MKNFYRFWIAILISFSMILDFRSSKVDSLAHSKSSSRLNEIENHKEITDGLYEIARVLNTNANISPVIYERFTVLESNISLMGKEEKEMKNRMQILEETILQMKESQTKAEHFYTDANRLNNETANLLKDFDLKLSTLATEILRMKNEASEIKLARNFVIHEMPVKMPFSSVNNSSQENIKNRNTKGNKVHSWLEICSGVLLPNGSSCLLTYPDKILNWTMAESFCRKYQGEIASVWDIDQYPLNYNTNLFSSPFWVRENDSVKQISHLDERLNILSFSDVLAQQDDAMNLQMDDDLQDLSKAIYATDDDALRVNDDKFSGSSVYKDDIVRTDDKMNENLASFLNKLGATRKRFRANSVPINSVNASPTRDLLSLSATPRLLLRTGKRIKSEEGDPQMKNLERRKFDPSLASHLPAEPNRFNFPKLCSMVQCNKDQSCSIFVSDCSLERHFWCKKTSR